MKIKTFYAKTVPEAMMKVKAELGSEAVILHTRKVKRGGFLGLLGSEEIEIVAENPAVVPAAEGRGVYIILDIAGRGQQRIVVSGIDKHVAFLAGYGIGLDDHQKDHR